MSATTSVQSTLLQLAPLLGVAMTSLALLAAFVTLAARELKAPSIVGPVFLLASRILSLLTGAVGLLIAFDSTLTWTARALAALIAFIFSSAAVYMFRLYNRLTNLRRDQEFRNFWPIRNVRTFLKDRKKGPSYEHDSESWPPALMLALEEIDSGADVAKSLKVFTSASIFYKCRDHAGTNERLVQLMRVFADHGCTIQYTCASRHPYEFMRYLQKSFADENDWNTIRGRIVVVDAFTAHFGFTDTVHRRRSMKVQEMCAGLLRAEGVFPGIHTATAQAFNLVKEKATARLPTLVIYEGLHSLIDLESAEQYRVFFRHVLASERMFGGMLTLVVEFSPAAQNSSIIEEYADSVWTQPGDDSQEAKS